MEKEKRDFQEWLEQLAEKEGVKLKIRFISNDYRPEAERNDTIKIPLELLSPLFRRIERKAVGAHELAHLKYRHLSFRSKWRRFWDYRYRLECEFQADRFAANVTRDPMAMILALKKLVKVREKWRRKNLIWSVKIWFRLNSHTHPPMEERTKRLQKP